MAGRGRLRAVGVLCQWRPLAAGYQLLVRRMCLEPGAATVGTRLAPDRVAAKALTAQATACGHESGDRLGARVRGKNVKCEV